MEKMIFSSLHEIGHCTTIENIVLHLLAKIAKQNIFSLLSGKEKYLEYIQFNGDIFNNSIPQQWWLFKI